MKDFLTYLIGRLVDEPEAVEVIEERREGAVAYTVHVAPPDMGKVIGRQGRIVNAVRLVTKGAGATTEDRIFVDVAD